MRTLITAGTLFAVSMAGLAQERDRSKIDDKYKWNLGDIYPGVPAWRAGKERLVAAIPSLGQYRGTLLSSPQTLADALEKMSTLDKELARLYVYASMLADEDTRDGGHQGMKQEMVQVAAAFAAEASYVEPEILRGDKATLEKFIASERRLTVYRFYLEDIIRRAAHTLTERE